MNALLKIVYYLLTLGVPLILDRLRKREEERQEALEANQESESRKQLGEALANQDAAKLTTVFEQRKQREKKLHGRIKNALATAGKGGSRESK